ncbi:unnamed protein product [Sphagnum jensenii]|uniref:tRNA dimethylallyltransferase n=1 Tax=Sphagnum jensenii TaxID=128206 RepID=A0ABP1BK74_9BRYO
MFTPRACPPASQLGSSSNCIPATKFDPLPPSTQKSSLHSRPIQWSRLSVRAKVAVGEGGRNRLLTTVESPPATAATETCGIEISARCTPCLEFAGRIGHGDRPMLKTALRTPKARVIVIAGPTAVGKTRVALALAKQLGGEIISADSVQVYKGLNVGSAKTPVRERGGVPHHVLDMALPTQEYTVGQFFNDARAATEMVLARDRVPIVVGGTSTYIHWYMNGIAGVPKATTFVNPQMETDIHHLQNGGGGGGGSWEAGVHMLAQAGDPVTAYNLAHNDLCCSLETVKVSGCPGAAFLKTCNYSQNGSNVGDTTEWDYDFQCYFLYQHRSELYHWIDLRCEQMVAETGGLLEEASWLLDMGVLPNTNSASRGIGYQEAMEFLLECRAAGGRTTVDRFLAFLSSFQKVSRNLVKKQLTWFRHDNHNEVGLFHWVDASQPLENIVGALKKEYRRRPDFPTELEGSEARKNASYKEIKVLKYYKATNRIFSNPEMIMKVLKWVRKTQGFHRFSSCTPSSSICRQVVDKSFISNALHSLPF